MDFALTATQPAVVNDAGDRALERLAARGHAREKEEAIEREVRLEVRPRGPLMSVHGETNGPRTHDPGRRRAGRGVEVAGLAGDAGRADGA